MKPGIIRGKGEIFSLSKMFDEVTCKWFWRATIDFEYEPDIKLGNCEVSQ